MVRMFMNAAAVLVLAVAGSAMPANGVVHSSESRRSTSDCSRDSMTTLVTQILDSMVAKDPYSLPLATIYKATENSHPAALGMMTSWRTVAEAGDPSLLAIDTTNCTAYFALAVSEGNEATEAVLRGRVATVDEEITELELFINRGRGDHGFTFSADEVPSNYEPLMNPPDNRTKASRETLWALSQALFAEGSAYSVTVSDDCLFTEAGGQVIDTGLYGNGSSDPLGCVWPDDHPTDLNARVGLVIDEELGFVVTSGIIPGTVYPYQNISAFIPNDMTSAQEAQDAWIEEMKAQGNWTMLSPTGATGDTLEVLQFYNGELQAMQINVYLSGPNMTSPWL
ncbi:hypothetical protein EDB81DRAFT_647124 [Dactylonectria macrodidyma]|uniref:Uncharacterized protein n=1 Tax=Dactylonectria macrodidyma TaxID=307937 RepID=A0A9P9J9V2_9HYPO|nr:hypothetical protein EDB81DRAFT_647124 [Dactylonectria macrodidyma]